MTTSPTPTIPNLVNRAETDLAHRLNISVDQIEVTSTQNDEFPGANFGCPQPEKPVTGGNQPAFVTATEIVLSAGGQRYHYRGKGIQVVFCFVED